MGISQLSKLNRVISLWTHYMPLPRYWQLINMLFVESFFLIMQGKYTNNKSSVYLSLSEWSSTWTLPATQVYTGTSKIIVTKLTNNNLWSLTISNQRSSVIYFFEEQRYELWSGFSPQNKHKPAYWSKRFTKKQNWGDWSCKFVVNLETLVTLQYLPITFTCLRVDFSMQGMGEGGWG